MDLAQHLHRRPQFRPHGLDRRHLWQVHFKDALKFLNPPACRRDHSVHQESVGAIRFEALMHRDQIRGTWLRRWPFLQQRRPPKHPADRQAKRFNLELSRTLDPGSSFHPDSILGNK